MAPGLFRLTYSKLAAFRQCRKKYWFRQLSGLQAPPPVQTPAGVVGTGVHRAMKVLCETGSPSDGANELDVYLRMPIHDCAAPGSEHHRLAFEFYEAGCQAHASLDSEDRFPELKTYVPSPSRGYTIESRIDRADRLPGGWQVTDWKTGRYEDDDSTDLQLDIGHLALRVMRRLPAEADVRAVAWNLRTGYQRVRALTRDDARATMDRLGHMAQVIQASTEFPAQPGFACSFCEWRPLCPEGGGAAEALDWLEDDEPADTTPDQQEETQ